MTLFQAFGQFAGSGAVASAPGMVLLTPTSITAATGTASIGANGQVTFSGVTSLSVNGVFTSTFDNYAISVRHVVSASNYDLNLRLRSAGSDASGADYTRQSLVAAATVLSAGRDTQTYATFAVSSVDQRSGDICYIYSPALAQPTATRNVNARGRDGASIVEFACTHSLSSSYDGFTTFTSGDNFTGALQVYGIRS